MTYRIIVRAHESPDDKYLAADGVTLVGDVTAAGQWWSLERAIELSVLAMVRWPDSETALDPVIYEAHRPEIRLCQRCKGSGTLRADLQNPGTHEYTTHIFGCDDCQGKGVRGDETGRVYAPTTYRNERPYGPILREAAGLTR